MNWFLGSTIFSFLVFCSRQDTIEEQAGAAMDERNVQYQKLDQIVVQREWAYALSLTSENETALNQARENLNSYLVESYGNISSYLWENFTNSTLKREYNLFSQLDEGALPVAQRTNLSGLIDQMVSNYSTMEVTGYGSNSDTNFTLGDIETIMAEVAGLANDSSLLAYYWDGWTTNAGRVVKSGFEQYVELSNQMAVLNNFTDKADYWQSDFETDDFEEEMAKLMTAIRPLFRQLHAYIRRKLWLAYGNDSSIIDLEGPIPASLTGNIWGLDCINIFNLTAPYRNKPNIDVTDALVAQGYTGLKMAQAAEAFYVSLNMSKMTDSFWDKSVFEEPSSGSIDCASEAFNWFDGENYTIKLCSEQTMDYYGQFHHEMAHIENYMTWSKLAWPFQDAPNPGFNEVIGDMMAMIVKGPTHLKTVGLLSSDFTIDEEQEINLLYRQAVDTVFFMPYAYTLDVWRWRVFQGSITPDNYTKAYWNIRTAEQGVEPPVQRDENDFDPGAKYHIVADAGYIQYFISEFLQCQLMKALCVAAGQYNTTNTTSNPLYSCDISNSTAAGEKLKSMMVLGRSVPWQDALEAVTGDRDLDAGPLLEYFQPLYDWLVLENEKTNETIGWTATRCN